jgi:hypothetical protein
VALRSPIIAWKTSNKFRSKPAKFMAWITLIQILDFHLPAGILSLQALAAYRWGAAAQIRLRNMRDVPRTNWIALGILIVGCTRAA